MCFLSVWVPTPVRIKQKDKSRTHQYSGQGSSVVCVLAD